MLSNITARHLAYCGALPFIFVPIVLLIGGNIELPFLGLLSDVIAAYSLMILSFMAGIYWGVYLLNADHLPINLFVVSNIIALLTWVAFLTLTTVLFLLSSIFLFMALSFTDKTLIKAGLYPDSYITLRRNVNGMVIGALLLTIWALSPA